MKFDKRGSKSKFVSLALASILLFVCFMRIDSISADSLEAPGLGPNDPEANLKYLFAVFFVAWVAFFGYMFFLSRRLRDLTRELEVLKMFLKEKDSHLGE